MNHDSCSFMNINNMCIELGGFQKIFGGKNSKFQSLKGASLRLIRWIGPVLAVHIISVNFAATWFEQTQKLTTKNEVDNWSTISDQFQLFDEYFRWQMDAASWVDLPGRASGFEFGSFQNKRVLHYYLSESDI